MSAFTIAALYKFVDLPDYQELREPILKVAEENHIKGMLLLAREGINGTVAGPRQGIDALLAYLRSDSRLADLVHKEAVAQDRAPFKRMRVRLKKEIVTMGQPNVNAHNAGIYVKPEDWNALISDPEVVVVDTRNDYEVNIGTFKGAVNPHTESFRQFPEWVQSHMGEGKLFPKGKKIAMFCTGGIRCEKSTAYMKSLGFDEVYHLEGGILKYLETIPEEKSLWQGQCYVFDDRVSVGHQLVPGSYTQCRACRHPLSPVDRESLHYIEGECCPYCYDKLSDAQRHRFRERQKQVDLAKAREEQHLGANLAEQVAMRRQAKQAHKLQAEAGQHHS